MHILQCCVLVQKQLAVVHANSTFLLWCIYKLPAGSTNYK